MTTSKKYCILVHQSDSLLSHAVLRLTYSEQSIEVVVSEANDINELAMEVSEFSPIVVLLDESQPMASKEALTGPSPTADSVRSPRSSPRVTRAVAFLFVPAVA